MKINCKHCNRYLFTATNSMIAEDVICSSSKCKAHMNFSILFATDATEAQLRHTFTAKETQPKEVK